MNSKLPIGIIVDSFRVDIKDAVKKAASLGAKGIQVYCTSGEMAPENMDKSKRSEFKKLVQDNGLVVSAVCGDLGGHGFIEAGSNVERIEKSKRILDLAKDFDTDVVTTHIGVIPEDKTKDRYKIMQEACFELSKYADKMNAHFAIETGPERAVVLKEFLDATHSRGVGVNLDPANLVMVTGDDPIKAVYTLKDYIVHTHAKDGRRLIEKDPEIIYGMVEEEIQLGQAFIELPLGEGDVDFVNYYKALIEIGYRGFLTIERECGSNPEKDIAAAVNFLDNLMMCN